MRSLFFIINILYLILEDILCMSSYILVSFLLGIKISFLNKILEFSFFCYFFVVYLINENQMKNARISQNTTYDHS